MVSYAAKLYAYRLKKKKNIFFNIEDRRKVHSLYKTYRRYEAISGIFSLISIIAILIDYEKYYKKEGGITSCNLNPERNENYRIAIVLTSFASIYSVLIRHTAELQWYDLVIFFTPDTSSEYLGEAFKKRRKFQLLFELFILIMMPLPFADFDMYIPQRYDHENKELCYRSGALLVCFSMLRSYFVYRALINYSTFHNEQTMIYCIQNHVKIGFGFAIKCIMNTHPLPLIGIFSLSSVLLGMFVAKVFEMPLEDAPTSFHENLFNYFWYEFQTIGTQGYGDHSCSTYGCKSVTAFTWFFGSVLVGLLICFMQKETELNYHQGRAYDEIVHYYNAEYLLKLWVRYIVAKKKKQSAYVLKSIKEETEHASVVFKEHRLEMKEKFLKRKEFKTELDTIKIRVLGASRRLDELIKIFKNK